MNKFCHYSLEVPGVSLCFTRSDNDRLRKVYDYRLFIEISLELVHNMQLFHPSPLKSPSSKAMQALLSFMFISPRRTLGTCASQLYLFQRLSELFNIERYLFSYFIVRMMIKSSLLLAVGWHVFRLWMV